ncbi:hypothetical protein HDU87_000332 [Geranomyces variabilis]|uniref:Smr domain-containing protein n=1 Tax=Geranomyces variabilis TaxID=109894 RepID=A0AAD5TND2_9FUNG|nr:hypothetical protein HDU87_000332 [Geranomyces variabilis]
MGSHLSHHTTAASSSTSTTTTTTEQPTESADHYRALADKAAAARNDCYERSRAAFSANRKADAKQLSTEGKAHAAEMARCNALAAKAAQNAHNNNNGSSFSSSSTRQIDLHGLFVKEALEALNAHVAKCRSEGVTHTKVITGQGLHSKDGMAKIKPAAEEWCVKNRVRATEDPRNAGVVNLELALAHGEHAGWFSRHCTIQ